MPERASIFETVQIGPETVPGTAVPATKKLSAMGISIRPAITSRRFRPGGNKLDTLIIPGRKSSEADVEGVGTFVDPCYALSSVLGTTTPTGVAGSTGAFDWIFAMNSSGPDNPKTFTVESGSSVRAARVTHGVFTEYGMTFNSEEVTVSGALIGQRYEDGITRTVAGVTSTSASPIIPDDTDVFIDTTFAALGTTKQLRAMSAEFKVGNRYSPLWVMNSANASWVAIVETAPDVTLNLTVAADAAGMANLTALETGATRYVRLKNEGSAILATVAKHLFQIDMAARVENIGSLQDQDGVFAATWNFRAIDTTSLAGVQVKVTNDLASL
jgi:hypothetical protein